MIKHDLHNEVARCFEEIIKTKSTMILVEKDHACGGNKNLPFFLTDEARNDTEITNVDVMIVNTTKKTVKLICEIEESDIKPIRTFGKVFVVIASKMCKLKCGEKYLTDENGIFIQVLSNRGLKKDLSKKPKQGANIEKSINTIIKSNGSWIKEYHLIYGEVGEFIPGKVGYREIEKIIRNLN